MTGSNVINVLKGAPAGVGEWGVVSNAQELTMQPSQTLSSAIAQVSFKQPNYKSHEKDLAPAHSSFFQFLYNLKINFLYIVLMGEGFSALFLPLAVVEERF